MIIVADKFTQTGRHVLFKLMGSRLHELYTYVDDVMEYKVWYPEQPSNEALQEEVAKQFAKWDAK
jgi:hypothetical protein